MLDIFFLSCVYVCVRVCLCVCVSLCVLVEPSTEFNLITMVVK